MNLLSELENRETPLPIYSADTTITPWIIIAKNCPKNTIDYIRSFTESWYIQDNMICPDTNLIARSASEKVFYPLSSSHNLELRWINGGSAVVHTLVRSFSQSQGSLFRLNEGRVFNLDHQCTPQEWNGICNKAAILREMLLQNKKEIRTQEKEEYKKYTLNRNEEKLKILENESKGHQNIGFHYDEYAPFELKINRFYASKEWTTLRNQVLEDKPSCLVCGANDNLNGDHIKPLRYHWHLRLDENNVQTLCARCNLEKGSSTDWNLLDHRVALAYRVRHGIKSVKGGWNAYK